MQPMQLSPPWPLSRSSSPICAEWEATASACSTERRTKKVMTVNGSGQTGKNSTLDKIKAAGITEKPEFSNHGLWATVPGAIAGMVKVIKEFGSGKLTLKDIFGPAIRLAEEGVAISYKTANLWEICQDLLRCSKNGNDFLINGRTPSPGDIFYAPKIAKSLRNVADSGLEAFYTGKMAQNMVSAVQEAGGVLTVEDFEEYMVNPPNPHTGEALSTDFHGVTIWEMRPNTVGALALVIFNVLKAYDLKSLGHNSPEYIHLLVETIKTAYIEAFEYLSDHKWCHESVEDILTEEFTQKLRSKFDPNKARTSRQPFLGSDTSYLAVVDEEGNGCSFFCSLFHYFGTKIIPDDFGFAMQDRARAMSLEEGSTSVFGPNKLPLTTLIPAIVTETATNDLLAIFGVMGGWMQPQGQLQVLLNMMVFGMDPQVALNQPRFFVGEFMDTSIGYLDSLLELNFEEGIDQSVVPFLESKGHVCRFVSGYSGVRFGNGHVIARSKLFDPNLAEKSSMTWWSGSDPRWDGCNLGY